MPVVAQRHALVKRFDREHAYLQPQLHLAAVEKLQKLFGRVYDRAEANGSPFLTITELHILFPLHLAIAIGYWRAMRVYLGEAQQLIHFLKESGRLDMLDLFGDLVYLFPAKAHFLHQEHFHKAVLTDNE